MIGGTLIFNFEARKKFLLCLMRVKSNLIKAVAFFMHTHFTFAALLYVFAYSAFCDRKRQISVSASP